MPSSPFYDDEESTQYARTPVWLFDVALSSIALHGYVVLMSFAGHAEIVNGRNLFRVWPSQKTLASRMHCSKSTAIRAIAELRKAGIIATLQGQDKSGREAVTTYFLVFDQEDRFRTPVHEVPDSLQAARAKAAQSRRDQARPGLEKGRRPR
jgi:DNA-binding transcriptional regulator YhcF (GntR family)